MSHGLCVHSQQCGTHLCRTTAFVLDHIGISEAIIVASTAPLNLMNDMLFKFAGAPTLDGEYDGGHVGESPFNGYAVACEASNCVSCEIHQQ